MAVKPVKVSQLNGYISRVLQTDPILGNLSVVGEISNLKYHGSGHVYFSLKDEKSTINCFLPAGNLGRIRYELNEGMEIIAHGYISVYQAGGRYSLNIRDIEVSGTGDLAIAFEKLKQKLEKEGIFDEAHKKDLPPFPKKIAVVTSETGAAVRDILKIIKSKNDITSVLVYPVLVQGPDAAADISRAIYDINTMDDIDLMIVGRGGGSIEDLWAFNEEPVARSIYDSRIPVISAVGHETDFTIADFAADRRAETPTAAAQLAVPDTEALREYLKDLAGLLRRGLTDTAKLKESKLGQIDLTAMKNTFFLRIDSQLMKTRHIKDMLSAKTVSLINERESRCTRLLEVVKAGDPAGIMQKGYAAVLDKDRNLIRGTEKLEKDDDLTLIFRDGDADCRVTGIRRKENER